ncbi:MAG: TatD family hydrolase [Candidatus Nitrosocosmicus sp.]|nr:TatD family hydrolase [Candidatus Nitrosocosmicus sp.]
MIFQLINNSNIECFCMSENLETSVETILLRQRCLGNPDMIHSFVGIHPQFARQKSDYEVFEDFFGSHSKLITGIGEIGLDPTYFDLHGCSYMNTQKWIFEQMLNLAEKNNKPISIHSRRSVDQILEILPSFRIKRAVFHWYDGSKKNLRKINDHGFFASFGPYLLYNIDKQNLFKECNPSFVLLETDGPVSYKNCFQDVFTTPSLIITLVYFISTLLRISFEEATRMIVANSSRFISY